MPEYRIQTGREYMQPQRIHAWLSTHSYWSKGIPYDVVQTAIDNSFCVGVFADGVQVGFARFITDYAIFAYLADVYVEEEHRGRGLSKQMMQTLLDQPFVAGLRRVMLATLDAHGLYEQFGFKQIPNPDRLMGIARDNIYATQTPSP